MEQTSQPPESLYTECLPPLQIRAFSIEDRQQLARFLPAALTASGGWLLRHEITTGVMRFIFEFERSNGMNVYVTLVGVGLELTRTSHLALTSFCQRTLNLPRSGSLQVATCELEIRDLSEEPNSAEPLLGANSST